MRLTTTLLLLFVLALPASAQYNTDWQRSLAASNLPSWFGASTERGLAYGTVGVNERLYVASRNGSTNVQILDASTGADVGTLDVTGIAGGLYPINDIEVSDDGVIMACNMTLNASADTNEFRCYTWTTEADAPTPVITYAAGAADRLGDKITLTGSCATNTATLWAASGNSTTVYKFGTTTNCASFDAPTTVTVDASMGSTPDVTPDFSGAGGFYGTGNGSNVNVYSAAGTTDGTLSTAIVGTASTALTTFTSGGRNYVGIFNFGAKNGLIVDATDGLATATSYGSTPTLGASGSPSTGGTGDVAVRDNGDGTFTLFVLATNNGLGAYTTNEGPLPVEMVSFDAVSNGTTARLTWTTASETNNVGFEVEQRVGGVFTSLGFIAGKGTTLEQNTYTFAAENLTPGRHVFRLVQRDFDGSTWASDEISVEIASEAPFALSAVRPNPASGVASVGLYVSAPQQVRVDLFDATGRLVQSLHRGLLEEGTATFHGRRLGAAIGPLPAARHGRENRPDAPDDGRSLTRLRFAQKPPAVDAAGGFFRV